jgi:membrane fusion protein (multidrug efflux system)
VKTNKGRTVWSVAGGIAVVLVILGTIAGIKALQFAAIGEAFATQVPAAERVNAVAVARQDWESRVSSVGTVLAVQGTEVSTEAEGVVRDVLFVAGSVVNAGDELLRLDDEVERSQLRAAEAAAELARLSLERAQRLIERRVIAQSDLEEAEAAWKQTSAQVDNISAIIAKKTVRAPFAGRLGIRRVSVGDFLVQGSPVVSLQSLDPVYVEFSLPQQRLGQVRAGLVVTAKADAYPTKEFTGEITAIEPQVDAVTRNVRIQATFSNGHRALTPGMFVSVEVALGDSTPVHVIPATAVVHAPHGDSIFVIEPAASGGSAGHVVHQRPVKLGPRRGDFVVVEDGASPNDQVVATGVFKLRPGMPVVVDNTLTPEFELEPSPDNG